MRAAKGDEVVDLVSAALGAELDVMKIQEQRVSATRNGTAVVVAKEYRPARRWRDGLLRASARVGARPATARLGLARSASMAALVRGGALALVRHGRIEQTQVLAIATTSAPTGMSCPLACWPPLPHSGQTESAI